MVFQKSDAEEGEVMAEILSPSPRDDGYISLSGLTKELGIENILMHTEVWELYLSHNFKVSLIRSLDILKAFLVGMNGSMPSRFTVDFGEERVSLVADFRIRDRCLLIDFDGGLL